MDPLTVSLIAAAVVAAVLVLLLVSERRSERCSQEVTKLARAMRAKIRAAASGNHGETP